MNITLVSAPFKFNIHRYEYNIFMEAINTFFLSDLYVYLIQHDHEQQFVLTDSYCVKSN